MIVVGVFLKIMVVKCVFQAVVKQLGGTGFQSSNVVVLDEEEMMRHQQLEKLYRSTRGGKVSEREGLCALCS